MSNSTKTIQEAHSRAKVELFQIYLKTYLNILSRATHIHRIKIFDLCCGEGVYSDNSEGSPVKLMRSIKDHYFANNKSCIESHLFFNDPGESDIQKGVKKIDRVKAVGTDIFCPPEVYRVFTSKDYKEVYKDTLSKVNGLKSEERALIFIDPWGYKMIKPIDINNLMANGKTEVLLFLPTSFMYRFARKSLNDPDFKGGLPLRSFLLELFKDSLPNYNDPLSFIEVLLQKFRDFDQVKFVDKFTIERGSGDYFCLFFFTNHIRGLQKIIEAKWKIDSKEGRGFELPKSQIELFTGHRFSEYPELLWAYLKKEKAVTNEQLLQFGLGMGYLPKHTRDILQQDKTRFKVEALDNLPVGGFYLGNSKRKVVIKYL
ncbi:three-Cys-motif partner protein TcmP [Owenweeksia hongkongensis]|uniref:three-Cys-motif partner protein TcmP n=1 Tax=Owenweeksia hongkongensis TaxID=253245 RepID=UPI003A9302FB